MRRWLSLAAVVAGVLTVPMLWRPAFAALAPAAARATPSYLPALEPARAREPFDPTPIDELRAVPPGLVIIGDSMAGRIHKRRLEELTREPVAPLLRNATGSAHWFLIFKNYVVASGVKPRAVIVFFRDTNLTDPMFRLGHPYRTNADALSYDYEAELNDAVASRSDGAWFGVHTALDRIYQVARVRTWLEPRFAELPAQAVAGRGAAPAMVTELNAAFTLDRLRPAVAADMAADQGGEPGFRRDVQRSVLPAFLALSRQHGIKLIFVRVLRRPEGGRAPAESPALRQYARDLAAYLDAGGAVLRDDRDYPGMASLPYDDGDHISRVSMVPYTELFFEQMAKHLR